MRSPGRAEIKAYTPVEGIICVPVVIGIERIVIVPSVIRIVESSDSGRVIIIISQIIFTYIVVINNYLSVLFIIVAVLVLILVICSIILSQIFGLKYSLIINIRFTQHFSFFFQFIPFIIGQAIIYPGLSNR
jgi:hypothetical protein